MFTNITKYQSTCFICTTWKLTQTMEQQPYHACERTKANQKQDQVTSHSNWPRVLLFHLAHKQRNGIIKWWFHCLTSESKGRFLVNECVPLTISPHLYFLRISKISSMLHHGSVGQAHSKECYFNFTCNFLTLFCYFSSKNLCFYRFHFLFWWSIKFPQQNINQSVTETGDKKLSLELYARIYYSLAQHDVSSGANPIFFNKKKIKIGRPKHSLDPHYLRPITSHFCIMSSQSRRHMCITPNYKINAVNGAMLVTINRMIICTIFLLIIIKFTQLVRFKRRDSLY